MLDRKQRMTSLPALVAEEFLRGRTSLVVAGTHGKTTTTSLLAFLLAAGGPDPSFLVGGVPVDFGRSYRLGGGAHFVVEGDEYDSAFFDKRPKFVHYHPDVAIIGNLEYDHADIYPDLAAVQTAFVRLLERDSAPRAAGGGDREPGPARDPARRPSAGLETFGLGRGADWRAEDVRPGARSPASASLVRRPRRRRVHAGPARRPQRAQRARGPGGRRRRGRSPRRLSREPWRAFRGVKRRLEVRGRRRGVAVYDDFAHHPTAVRETLEALRAAPRRPAAGSWPVFEPRSYTSRTRVFQEDFARAFSAPTRWWWRPPHLPGKVPEAERLLGGIWSAGIAAAAARPLRPSVEAIVERLVPELREGDRGGRPVQRRLRRPPREAARARRWRAPAAVLHWPSHSSRPSSAWSRGSSLACRPPRRSRPGPFCPGRDSPKPKEDVMKRFAAGPRGARGVARRRLAQDASPRLPPREEGRGKEEGSEDTVKREEVVVVTASRVESTLVNAPATISVIGTDVIATAPAQNYGDLLRNVPGLNVIQMSARDINMTSRQATTTLSNSQLVLLDGRSIYLDFFGLILWDLVPASTGEIKQIEVVRGPASAVWGANALTGVVNIITKPPRELAKASASP